MKKVLVLALLVVLALMVVPGAAPALASVVDRCDCREDDAKADCCEDAEDCERDD